MTSTNALILACVAAAIGIGAGICIGIWIGNRTRGPLLPSEPGPHACGDVCALAALPRNREVVVRHRGPRPVRSRPAADDAIAQAADEPARPPGSHRAPRSADHR